MFQRVLILCTGNICRSPLAQALLQQRMRGARRPIEVRSAGIGALVGEPADATIRRLGQARGLDISGHRARQVTPDLLRWAELVLVMDNYQKEAVRAMDPTARGKTFLLGHWSNVEVPDPYRRGVEVHTRVMALVDQLLKTWVDKLGACS